MTFTQTFSATEVKGLFTPFLAADSGEFRGGELKVEVDLPGVEAEGIKVSFAAGKLTIGHIQDDEKRHQNGTSGHIIAQNSRMKVALSLAQELAKTSKPVIICGEHGTGKDLFAETIHQLSDRSHQPFVPVACGTLGKGGAHRIDEALLRAAGGTLFLDGLHDLSVAAQEELTRKIAGRTPLRVISATCCDPDKLVAQGRFSAQLLEQLRGGYIELLPLRERREDISPLASYYLERYCRKSGFEMKILSADLLQLLAAYRWPGNVRELNNTLEQLILTARRRQTLFARDLPDHIRIETHRSSSVNKQGL